MSKENSMEQTKNDEKEPITKTEVLDGCVGCSSLGCLPFTVVFLAILVGVF